MNKARLDWHLDNWARYMRVGGNPTGVKISSLYGSGGTVSSDAEFDIMADGVEKELAKKFWGCIKSLTPPQQTAIDHVWLGASFCWPTQELDYEEAIEELPQIADRLKVS